MCGWPIVRVGAVKDRTLDGLGRRFAFAGYEIKANLEFGLRAPAQDQRAVTAAEVVIQPRPLCRVDQALASSFNSRADGRVDKCEHLNVVFGVRRHAQEDTVPILFVLVTLDPDDIAAIACPDDAPTSFVCNGRARLALCRCQDNPIPATRGPVPSEPHPTWDGEPLQLAYIWDVCAPSAVPDQSKALLITPSEDRVVRFRWDGLVVDCQTTHDVKRSSLDPFQIRDRNGFPERDTFHCSDHH